MEENVFVEGFSDEDYKKAIILRDAFVIEIRYGNDLFYPYLKSEKATFDYLCGLKYNYSKENAKLFLKSDLDLLSYFTRKELISGASFPLSSITKCIENLNSAVKEQNDLGNLHFGEWIFELNLRVVELK